MPFASSPVNVPGYSPDPSQAWGKKAVATKSTGAQTITTTLTDITDMSVTFNVIAGRQYLISGKIGLSTSNAGAFADVRLRTSTNVEVDAQSIYMPYTGRVVWATLMYIYTPGSSGSATFKLSATSGGTTADVFFSAIAPVTLLAQDIGPA